MFDPVRYDREVLRPLRGTHGELPQTNLMARYAVEPGMSADRLAEHLTEIRAWWAQRAAAPDSRAQVCRLLIDADQRLIDSAGAAMNDPAWWLEYAEDGSAVPRPADPAAAWAAARAPDPARPRAVTATPVVAGGPSDWRDDARIKFWSQLAALGREPDCSPVRPVPVRAEYDEAPAPPPRILEVEVVPIGAVEDRCQVEVSWDEARFPDVRVRWGTEPPVLGAGDRAPAAAVESWGRPLTGPSSTRGGLRVQRGTVPTGYLTYLPFAITGSGATVGRPVATRIAGPVHRLRVERRGADALISWIWPGGSTTAIVDWCGRRREVTLADYSAGPGCLVAAPPEGGTATVRALCVVGDDLALSPPRSAVLAPAPVQLSYVLSRSRRLGRRPQLVIGVRADTDCSGVSLDVVTGDERVMPADAGHGDLHARLGPLTLARNVETQLTVELPRPVRRDGPFWIRCFFSAPFPFSAQDPPVAQMRIS
jgi:hypothetical protein